MSFNGDLYPTAGADVVMTTKGDVVRYDSQRERLGVGSTNQVLAVTAGLPAWKTLTTADSTLTTQGDILYEGAAGLARLGQSTDGFVLTTKGASANPVWAASGGLWSQLSAVDLSGGASASLEATLSSKKNFLDINMWGAFASADILGCQMGDGSVSTASIYASNVSQSGATSSTALGTFSDFSNSITGSNFYCKIFMNNNSADLNSWVGSMTSNNLMWNFTGYFNSSVQIDQFKIYGTDGANNLSTATNMVVYGI